MKIWEPDKYLERAACSSRTTGCRLLVQVLPGCFCCCLYWHRFFPLHMFPSSSQCDYNTTVHFPLFAYHMTSVFCTPPTSPHSSPYQPCAPHRCSLACLYLLVFSCPSYSCQISILHQCNMISSQISSWTLPAAVPATILLCTTFSFTSEEHLPLLPIVRGAELTIFKLFHRFKTEPLISLMVCVSFLFYTMNLPFLKLTFISQHTHLSKTSDMPVCTCMYIKVNRYTFITFSTSVNKINWAVTLRNNYQCMAYCSH